MKKLNKYWGLALATLIGGVLAVSIALGQSGGSQPDGRHNPRPGQGRGHWGDHFPGFALRGLNLTDAQKEQLKQINQSFRERTKSLREQLSAKHEELRSLNSGESFDESLVTQKLTEVAALRAKIMGEEFKLRQEVKSILTDEQKSQLEQLKAKRTELKPRRFERRAMNDR